MSDKTTILSRQGQTLYRVSTAQNPDSKDIETAIQRGEGETIAVLHWRGLLPDKLESTLEEVQAPQIKYCKFLRSLKCVFLNSPSVTLVYMLFIWTVQAFYVRDVRQNV